MLLRALSLTLVYALAGYSTMTLQTCLAGAGGLSAGLAWPLWWWHMLRRAGR